MILLIEIIANKETRVNTKVIRMEQTLVQALKVKNMVYREQIDTFI